MWPWVPDSTYDAPRGQIRRSRGLLSDAQAVAILATLRPALSLSTSRTREFAFGGSLVGRVNQNSANGRLVNHFPLSLFRQRVREHFGSLVRIEGTGTPKNRVRTESMPRIRRLPQLARRCALRRASRIRQRRGAVHRFARDLDWLTGRWLPKDHANANCSLFES